METVHQEFLVRYTAPDSVVWDIGANLGLFAFPAAMKAVHVFAFEPDVDMVRLMQRTKALNPTLSTTIIPCALSNTIGLSYFLISRYGRAMNKLKGEGQWHDGAFQAVEERLVPTLTIDSFEGDLPPPTILKIDAEGADYKVLLGGAETIRRHRPIILIETPNELSEPITRFFREHGYKILDPDRGFQEVDAAPWNAVAVPRDVAPLT
jgi:FkbM family methyltransferase